MFEAQNHSQNNLRFPDENTVREIDRIIINKKWGRPLQDVRARGGASVGSDISLHVFFLKNACKHKEYSDLSREVGVLSLRVRSSSQCATEVYEKPIHYSTLTRTLARTHTHLQRRTHAYIHTACYMHTHR